MLSSQNVFPDHMHLSREGLHVVASSAHHSVQQLPAVVRHQLQQSLVNDSRLLRPLQEGALSGAVTAICTLLFPTVYCARSADTLTFSSCMFQPTFISEIPNLCRPPQIDGWWLALSAYAPAHDETEHKYSAIAAFDRYFNNRFLSGYFFYKCFPNPFSFDAYECRPSEGHSHLESCF
jgi:hypothetical protein